MSILKNNLVINTKNYNYKSWMKTYDNKKVNLKNKNYDESWNQIFEKLMNDKNFEELENFLSKRLENNVDIFPYPNLIYNAFSLTPFNKIKVVIIGQDPYFNFDKKSLIPEAMGLSFSVPLGVAIPSSLNNIYKNLIKFNHCIKKPTHGNLEYWAYQGCLMLNTALTVELGEKNCHYKIWKWFTDSIIKYISDELENIIFVLWGAQSYKMKELIDISKHKIIVSSHPSGLSYSQKLKDNPSFEEFDHFTAINNFLISFNKKPIIWEIPIL